MVKIPIVSLIYKSKKFADWVYESLYEFTPMIHKGEAEFFFIANDPEGDLVDYLTAKGYKFYVNINPRRTEAELFKMGYAKPEYIHRVYRGWNKAIRKAQGELVVLVNSDNYFSTDWLENLLKFSSPHTVVCSQLVERKHPKYGIFPGAYHGEFGNHPTNFKKDEFLSFANKLRITGFKQGGAYMPCMFYKDIALKAELYPEGNIAGRNYDDVAFYGDEYFFNKLAKLGVKHITSLDSIVYHLKEGEMDEVDTSTFIESISPSVNFSQEKPFFSVIIPTYNQANLLNEALDSLINQTFKNWEAIVVNDGSTDYTALVMEDYTRKDSRIKCFHKDNGGTASALNYGIKKASGEWICWLSSDDLFEPNKLEIHFNAIQENPDIKFFHSHWYVLLDETKQKIAPGLWLQIPPTEFQVIHFLWANYIHGNAVAIHKTVFDEVGFFDESLRQGQDFDMWLRISQRYISYFINKRTCITRIHAGQTTNSFAEGGVLDSTRSLINFLNKKPFEALFPFTDFRDPNKVLMALNEVVYISIKKDAFIYRCGFTSALVERTLEWLSNSVQPKVRRTAYDFLEKVVKDYLSNSLDEEIKNVLKLFLNRKKVFYKKHDFISDTISYVDHLIEKGDQKQAAAVETYLIKVAKLFYKHYNDKKNYEPKILYHEYKSQFSTVNPKKIKKWVIEPSTMVSIAIKHIISIECEKCSTDFNILIEYEMSDKPSKFQFICPSCKHTYEFNDGNLTSDFAGFHKNTVKQDRVQNNDVNVVAFFIRDASVVSGGTKVLFKHIEWLLKLGVNVTVYTFTKMPDWINLKLNYVQINDINQIDNSLFNKIVVFSIFDVPLILNKVPISKVVHFCQGYEGYHFGRTYDELRSDKHILTMLHGIPVKNISVSKHLLDLFKEKFNRDSEYIPNSVNHNIFKFSNYLTSEEKSILFIGNPLHPLKGFEFLAASIKTIQKSGLRISNLKLNIVMGFKHENIGRIRESLIEELNCEIEIKAKLTSEEIATLIKSSSVVVCTSWYEGFSLPILEAMASGIPVITTKNMGAESFCEHRKNSFVVNYGDLQNFIKYMLSIFNSDTVLNSILRNAYRSSLEFSELNSLKALINVYQKLLGLNFEKEKVDLLLTEIGDANKSDLYIEESIQKNISIVIPVYNNLEYTRRCLESLIKFTPRLNGLIIIDNASMDQTKEYLAELKGDDSRLKIILNSENIGFPKAVNQGLKECESEFVVIANNDIIFTKGWASRLIEIADSDEKIGIVGPISNIVSGVQLDKNARYSSIEEMHKYAAKVRKENAGKYFEFPRVAFLCTLIKREVIDKIGGLDERFSPGNFEDDDFCLRAQLAGYKTVVAQDVFIHHFGSKSFMANGTEEYAKKLEHNKQVFIEKWGADPEEIWLKGTQFKKRNPLFPIDINLFVGSMNRAMIYLEDKDYQQALIYLNDAIKNFDNYPKKEFNRLDKTDLLNLAGNTAMLLNDFGEAQKYFEEELKLQPSSSRACLGLAEVFAAAEMYNEAKTMYEWSLKNDPLNEKAAEGLIRANANLNIGDFHFLLSSSNHVEEKLAESEKLIESNNLENARKILLEILSDNPFDLDALNNLSVLFIMEGNNNAAIKIFERIQKIDPQNEIAMENLKYLNSILVTE